MTRPHPVEPPGTDTANDAGLRMFARYAYVPNQLGYCGPPESGALTGAASSADPAAGMDEDTRAAVRAAARRFSGAWPYLRVLARLHGFDDPLEPRVVEAYWLGTPLPGDVDPHEFGKRLLDALGPQASQYWKHLTPELLDEAAANHSFHVFGVYPWSRLLGTGSDQPLRVLDSCRIRWGTVLDRHGDVLDVSSRRLIWDGTSLGLGSPTAEQVQVSTDGVSFIPDAAPGDTLALHWDRLTDRLSTEQVAALESTTLRQLAATNRRLAQDPRPGLD